MRIPTETIYYHQERNPLPSPPILLRLIRLFPWLIKLPFASFLLLKLFNQVNNSKIAPGFYAAIPQYLAANNVNLNDTVCINYAPIIIGDGTRFSGENILLTSTHQEDDFETVIAKSIIIGKNVWLTYRCIVLGGVKIGDNVIIGAGSVVTKDIPSNVLAAGNPCRVIKNIHPCKT